MKNRITNQTQFLDQYSKDTLLKNALQFYYNPFKQVDTEDLKRAKIILNEIENWELEFGHKEFSATKNNAILVSFLAYRFGELLGLNNKEISNLYIASLVYPIGKLYICDEDKALAYEYSNSSLQKGEKGFKKIKEALKRYPSKTKEFLEENTKFNQDIIDTASSFHSVYSNLFKDGYPNIDTNVSQLDTILWFSNSLTAISFGSNELLKSNYKKDKYVPIIEALEILRDQTQSNIPLFWSKASNATIMGIIFSLTLGISSPGKTKASNYTSEEVVNLVNEYRKENGLELVEIDTKLVQAANLKAQDMLEKNYWDHYGPNGESAWTFIKDQGYSYTTAGENLAKGFDRNEKMFQAWIDSPTHKKNIENPNFNEIGVAVMDGKLQGKNVTLVVQIFANEKESPKEIILDSYDKILTSIKDFFTRISSTLAKR